MRFFSHLLLLVVLASPRAPIAAQAQKQLARSSRIQSAKSVYLIFMLSADPYKGGYIITSGGQAGSVENGHIDEDRVPNYNRQAPVRYVFLTVIDPKTGDTLRSDSHRWGGLLTGFNTAGERLVKKLENQTKK